jgi:hypothetical protein
MALWQCRDAACAWQGPWYACRWDGWLYLCCPACGAICDPDLAGCQASALDRLAIRGGGLLFVLLGLTVLWHTWSERTTDPVMTLTVLLGAVGLMGCGLLGLVQAGPRQRPKQ